jgi:chromosome segregation ATPase
MNIQDIADFLDLVKNPAKYERVLSNIKAEQDRLNTVIETVGKASELDKLRKEVETKADTLNNDYAKKVEDLEKSYVRKTKKAESLASDLEQKLAQAAKELEVAVNKQRAAEDLANSFTGRDKKLKEQEELVANLREELKASVSEYNEKLSKLRSVMS